jgi:hypothetical protein
LEPLLSLAGDKAKVIKRTRKYVNAARFGAQNCNKNYEYYNTIIYQLCLGAQTDQYTIRTFTKAETITDTLKAQGGIETGIIMD